MTTMQFSIPILLAFVLFSNHFGSGVYAKSCKKDQQCTVTNRICALCIQGRGPACTTSICLDGRCGVIDACSLELSGTCTADGDCITPFFCEACKGNRGPACAQARCFSGQCATIGPCTIQT